MTRSELIAKLARRNPQLLAKDAEFVVSAIIEAMTMSLVSGRRIEIRGFGTFKINYRTPRAGHNPNSGEEISVPEKYVPHFKAGKELRKRVDGEPRQESRRADSGLLVPAHSQLPDGPLKTKETQL